MKRFSAGSSAVMLLIGCSDSAAPDPGTFRAHLNGVRLGALSGESSASPFFGAEYPDARFAVRMFAINGDEVRALVLHCPGEDPPAPATYALSESASDCAGTYSRVITTQESGTTILELAVASSGQLTIDASDQSEVAGSFSLQGALEVESDTVGTLRAIGAFSATIVP